MKTLTVNENDKGQRLDKFITKSVKALPMSLLYKYIRTKKIKVNKKRADIGSKLDAGDIVELYIKDEFFDDNAVNNTFRVLKPQLRVVFENGDMMICDKRPGMLCHPDDNGEDTEEVNTLVNHIKAYLYQKGEYKPEEENSFVPALCNRIDRNTGGLVIAAKNAPALRRINELIREKKVIKKYLCMVHGTFTKKSETLTGYLLKDHKNNTVQVLSDHSDSTAQKIITKYKVLGEYNIGDSDEIVSLLEVELITGKTHQIRAHMASVGHPLLGDGKYGVNRNDRKLGFKYQALYSYYIELEGNTYQADEPNIWFLNMFKKEF
jgi:23S rRNA pseudouridine955/2504/2580 synthase